MDKEGGRERGREEGRERENYIEVKAFSQTSLDGEVMKSFTDG